MDFSKIQVGIDLATSATIIISAVAFWSQYARRASEAQRADKIERTRATALSRLYEISNEFEDGYRDLLKVHGSINLMRTGNPYNSYSTREYDKDVHQSNEHINNLMAEYQRFAQLVYRRRFTLLPLLEVIDEETVSGTDATNQSKSSIWQDALEILRSDMRLCYEHDYLNQLYKLTCMVDAALNDNAPESSTKTIMDLYATNNEIKALTRKIITNYDFQKFNKALYSRVQLEENDKEEFFDYVNDNKFTRQHMPEKMLRIEKTIDKLAAEFLGQTNSLLLHRKLNDAEYELKKHLDKSTLLCKTFLINISALLYKTLRNEDKSSFTEIVKRYEGQHYLSKESMHL